MIIWSGWGILAILPVVVMLVVGDSIDTSGLGLAAEQRDGLFWMATGVVGALFVFALDRWRASRNPDRVLVDPQTGQEVVYRRQDSLFFIPLRYMWILYLIGAVVGAVMFVRVA